MVEKSGEEERRASAAAAGEEDDDNADDADELASTIDHAHGHASSQVPAGLSSLASSA